MTEVSARIGAYIVGDGQPLLLIAGPCIIESEELTLSIAQHLNEIIVGLPVQLVFKASFDKANRTSGEAFRGAGLDAGLAILDRVKKETGLPVTTDIHESWQAEPAAAVCDLLQIPAFLARQTDLLIAAAKTSRAVNVKKGQFMAPEEMEHVARKLRTAGCQDVLFTERGTFFGYGRLVNDMTALLIMRRHGAPVIFDATHSVQMPASLGESTGANREAILPLARAATAFGIHGLFCEVHPQPNKSPSDSASILNYEEFSTCINQVLAIRKAI